CRSRTERCYGPGEQGLMPCFLLTSSCEARSQRRQCVPPSRRCPPRQRAKPVTNRAAASGKAEPFLSRKSPPSLITVARASGPPATHVDDGLGHFANFCGFVGTG